MKKSFVEGWSFKKEGGDAREVCLPHDAMQEETRAADAPSGSGGAFYPGGKYTYCKTLVLGADELGLHYTLEFEGVYKKARVYVNDELAGGCVYGYRGFDVVMDPFIKEGANEIRVEVDNSEQPESRWYSGTGIYRPVWLHVDGAVRIVRNGIKISTVSISPAKILVTVEHEGGEVSVAVYEQGSQTAIASACGDNVELEIADAKLWSAESPYLYDVAVTLSDGGAAVCEQHTAFGIRTLAWKGGFFVNGEKVLLKGGCLHHDNGIIGACEYQASADRKVLKLKEMGYNAIRSAHNPCSEAMLSACDRYGMYMMDETWDMWYKKKNPYDYSNYFMDNYKDDIKAMIDKDFNHPCVVMYSLGNEVSEPANEKGVELAGEMVEICHGLDASRPVTAGMNLMIIKNSAKGKDTYSDDGGLDQSQNKDTSGMNSTMFNMMASMVGSGMNKGANGKKADAIVSPVLDKLDMCGYNYGSGRYKEDQGLHPDRIIFGSETFPQDLAGNWQMVEQLPNLVGDFMWTAWDYLGETGIGSWSYSKDATGFSNPYPWILADTGAFDILGNPNGEALWAKVIWGASDIEIGVQPCDHPGEKMKKAVWRGTNALPSWSWKGCEGNKVVVEVYTKAPVAKLYVNGVGVGKKKVKNCRAIFKTKYEAGVLTALACDASGNEIARTELKSGKGDAVPAVTAEKDTVKVGDACYIDISMLCSNGVVDLSSDETVEVSVTGASLLAAGSAAPRTEEVFLDPAVTTYHGKAQAVVRASKPGTITVTVSGKNSTASCTVTAV